MRLRWSFVTLIALAISFPLAKPGFAQEKATPSVVIRVKAVEQLLETAAKFARLAGKQDEVEQIEAFIKSKINDKSLEGIDIGRPLGAYLRFGKELEDISGAVLLPVADEKAFLTLLQTFAIQANKDAKGIYTVQTGKNFDIYFRFANKYLYISAVNSDNLSDGRLLNPAAVLEAKEMPLVSTEIRLDQVPEGAKLLALASVEQELQKAQEKDEPNESPFQKEFRVATLKEMGKLIAGLLKDGQQIKFALDVTKEISLNFGLSGIPNSDLAKSLKAINSVSSIFAGSKKDTAATANVNLQLPDSMKAAFAKLVEEAMKKAVADINVEANRDKAKAFFDGILPTVRSGHFDGHFAMVGPTGKNFTLVAGLKLADGDKLGKTVHQLAVEGLKTIPDDQRSKVALEMDSVGEVKIHRVEVPKDGGNREFLEKIPGDPNLFVAFRKDALLLAMGPQALPTLKAMIASQQGAPAPAFSVRFDAARAIPVLAKNDHEKNVAAKVFTAGTPSLMHLTVEGGNALNLRFSMDLQAIEFFSKAKMD